MDSRPCFLTVFFTQSSSPKGAPRVSLRSRALTSFFCQRLIDPRSPARQAAHRPFGKLNDRLAAEPVVQITPAVALGFLNQCCRQSVTLNVATEDVSLNYALETLS